MPTPENDVPWQIHGSIPKAKISPQYRLATALVAFVMLLLPIIYLGIIGATAWWVYDYASAGPSLGRSGRGSNGRLMIYLVPIVIGAVVILFMIKPLFHRRPKSVENRALKREKEPRLFAFIDQICDLVHAPRPRRVQVDLQVNASAGLTHGMWSILTRNLTLTIGLPLAGGLSVRQFGGVLAHEFGHFAQGAGMGTTYIVRMISMWFARVVYERDQWDAALESWARGGDWRIMIVLQLTRLVVWFVRRILWVLMMIGHFFSSVLMRQMEFDADHYEIQTSGSEGFVSTAHRLRLLNVGAQVTHGKQEESYRSKRLVDDLAGWMVHETRQLSPEICHQVIAAANHEKTGWLDTHPSDSARIARAEAAQSAGILSGDEPASVLFADFPALSREITVVLYRDIMQLPEKEIALQPLATMASESDATKQNNDALDRLFHKLLNPWSLTFIRPEDLDLAMLPPSLPPAEPTEQELAASKILDEQIDRQNEMQAVLALYEATIPVDFKRHKLPGSGGDYARQEGKRAAEQIQAATSLATPVIERGRARIVVALRWLLRQADTPAETAAQIRQLVTTLSALEPLIPKLHSMRALVVGMTAVLNGFEQASDKDTAFQTAKAKATQLELLNNQIYYALQSAPYPFEHASGQVMIKHFLADGIAHPDGTMLTYFQSDAILDRIYGIYGRAIGRLAALAVSVEARMEPAGGKPPDRVSTEPALVASAGP